MQKKLTNIYVLPAADNPLFQQRESGVTHTPYMAETVFYTEIQKGNVEGVSKMLEEFLASGIVVGRLSDDPVRQMKYWAVCCITLGMRYGIQGGLDEMTAYNLADEYIKSVDKLESADEIMAFLERKVIEFTVLIRNSAHGDCPVEIRRCLDYIDKHLHGRIRLKNLAELTHFSEDYLSRKFKKHTGQSVSEYVLEKKLEAAKALLLTDCDKKMLPYYLGFCSQTYFITCFKKKFGITPFEYASRFKGL